MKNYLVTNNEDTEMIDTHNPPVSFRRINFPNAKTAGIRINWQILFLHLPGEAGGGRVATNPYDPLYRGFKGNGANWHFFRKSNAIDIELARETAISDISIEYITQTANTKTEFVPLCRSFRLVKYGQWFVDQIDFTYARVYGLVRAATSCRWVCRYSLNRHPCTSIGQTIIDIGTVLVKHRTYVLRRNSRRIICAIGTQ